MSDLQMDSDGESGQVVLNSSQSSMSSSGGSCEDRRSSFCRFSFDDAAPAVGIELPSAPSRLSSKPHRSSDPAWAAIWSRAVDANLGPRDFKLVRRIGSGDIGTVYLCRLRDEASPCAYAMKVVDKLALKKKKKLERAATEKRILRVLDHPFLPTLYADFDASPHYSCVLMEYCSGGDLHTLRHRQPRLRFSVAATSEAAAVGCDDHFRADPSCLPFRGRRAPRRASKADRRFVAEPVGARSRSFVGTHEYVAPEVAAGRPHGSAVDWWAYGILIYELLYGRTPFAGPTNESTLRNIVRQPLAFPALPSDPSSSSAVRDLIAGLLAKDPATRLGSRRGAADVKAHPFFKGLNLALMRCCRPPVVPSSARSSSSNEPNKPARLDYF
ncbi:hypothetical protein C4D60_Mb07t27420 [Musa balbisiana]|uniref:non-specific serine/threonine protein kinase n=1 Tax=Musa balbisiana TaxID=52838 RepID=A0A4S8JKW0_MUSBA|nr:hypothetical protein C4D60_Mb07t27420 [Musa balbisiana]